MPEVVPRFPIPASLQDLEREPYNLLPYPHDFDDDDEAARADSFSHLVTSIERGNQNLMSGGAYLFQEHQALQECDVWMDGERIQAMYTLVRYDFEAVWLVRVVVRIRTPIFCVTHQALF